MLLSVLLSSTIALAAYGPSQHSTKHVSTAVELTAQLRALQMQKFSSEGQRQEQIYKLVRKNKLFIRNNPFDQSLINEVVAALAIAQDADDYADGAELLIELESSNPDAYKKALASIPDSARQKRFAKTVEDTKNSSSDGN